ncbi:unnamed protein product [Phytophthora lilii]|uniref:Unnamed protein product n=1 Tax=Phytophthora lilii TaxID=2077276 RepID=A0A9W6TNU6_9STRA|nr:unnamed protein product [Phytophthora lilii]
MKTTSFSILKSIAVSEITILAPARETLRFMVEIKPDDQEGLEAVLLLIFTQVYEALQKRKTLKIMPAHLELFVRRARRIATTGVDISAPDSALTAAEAEIANGDMFLPSCMEQIWTLPKHEIRRFNANVLRMCFIKLFRNDCQSTLSILIPVGQTSYTMRLYRFSTSAITMSIRTGSD